MKKEQLPFIHISRRDFLKFSAFGLLEVTLSSSLHSRVSTFLSTENLETKQGRVLKPSAVIYDSPHFSANPIKELDFNTLINLTQEIQGDDNQYNNRIWFQLKDGGFIHSGDIQLVDNLVNPIQYEINRDGQLAQVSVPFTQAWRNFPNTTKGFEYIYFGSTHWIEKLVSDGQGRLFYRIHEDRWGKTFFVNPTHMHVFGESELQPISAEVAPQNKRIEVRLSEQTINAFEGEKTVFISAMSSGLLENRKDFTTPTGTYSIRYKRPSRHMIHGDRTGFEDSDLYGVPWISYFTDTGIAFHGTYWHNDFGFPRSHGCINLPISAARWLYFWTTPTVPLHEKTFISNNGTQILVV